MQWRFEKVAISEDFPLGVKTQYRAFAHDEVIEIVRSPFPPDTIAGALTGLKAQRTLVFDYPRDNPSGRADGMFILQKFPSTPLQPSAFEPGSRKDLEKTMSKLLSCSLILNIDPLS